MSDTIRVRGSGGVVFEMQLPLSEVYACQVASGQLTVVDDNKPEAKKYKLTEIENAMPKVSESKQAWVDYGVEYLNYTADVIASMSKNDLVNAIRSAVDVRNER